MGVEQASQNTEHLQRLLLEIITEDNDLPLFARVHEFLFSHYDMLTDIQRARLAAEIIRRQSDERYPHSKSHDVLVAFINALFYALREPTSSGSQDNS